MGKMLVREVSSVSQPRYTPSGTATGTCVCVCLLPSHEAEVG